MDRSVPVECGFRSMQAEQIDAWIRHYPWQLASHREIVSAVTIRLMFDIIGRDGMLSFHMFVNLVTSLISNHHNSHW